MTPLSIALLFLAACFVAVAVMMLSVSKGAGLLFVVSRLLPWTRPQIYREQRQMRADGFAPHAPLEQHVGNDGTLETDARPVGRARFGTELVDVESESDMLRRGQRVRAVEVRGGALVVRLAPRP